MPPSSAAAPDSLENLCLTRYLCLLQDSCAVFVQLCRVNSRLLASVRQNAIPAMRAQLDQSVFGTASSSLRQKMADRILDGEFPCPAEYHNQYESTSSFQPSPGGGAGGVGHLGQQDAFYETEQDLKAMEEVSQAGRKCNSVCCTGTFVAEAMLAVVLGPDVKKLDFNLRRRAADRDHRHPFWNKNKIVRKYVTFQVKNKERERGDLFRDICLLLTGFFFPTVFFNLQVPAVLAHYTRSLRKADLATTIKLERLHVKGTEIPSRQFAARKNHFEVLTSYQELECYLHIPGMLSQMATAETHHDGAQYGAFSEHLILALGEMFWVR